MPDFSKISQQTQERDKNLATRIPYRLPLSQEEKKMVEDGVATEDQIRFKKLQDEQNRVDREKFPEYAQTVDDAMDRHKASMEQKRKDAMTPMELAREQKAQADFPVALWPCRVASTLHRQDG